MQTAIVRYAGPATSDGQWHPLPRTADKPPSRPTDVIVDLIGAVHIADIAYYRQLNERFKTVRCACSTSWSPRKERSLSAAAALPMPTPSGPCKTPSNRFSNWTTSWSMSTTRSRISSMPTCRPTSSFRPCTIARRRFLQLYFRMMGQAMAQQSDMQARGDSPDLDLFSALFSEDRPRTLKIALAKQLAEMESLMVSLGGEKGSVLITERNKRRLKCCAPDQSRQKEIRHLLRRRPPGRHARSAPQRLRPRAGRNHLAHRVGPRAEALVARGKKQLLRVRRLYPLSRDPDHARHDVRAYPQAQNQEQRHRSSRILRDQKQYQGTASGRNA